VSYRGTHTYTDALTDNNAAATTLEFLINFFSNSLNARLNVNGHDTLIDKKSTTNEATIIRHTVSKNDENKLTT